jgi:anti-sigma B factor antagonist
MPGLEWKIQPVDGDDTARLVELSGAIDGNTVPDFQTLLEQMKKEGVRRLILDMSKIKYVNSTGLGSLVKYADSFKSSGGGMALIKVPAKVKIVIEMLGLNAFFDICTDLAAALAALDQKQGGPEAKAVAPPAAKQAPRAPGSSGPNPAVPKPQPQALAASSSTRQPLPPPAAPPRAAAPAGPRASFPIVTQCQQCGVQVEFRDAGNWKCPRCYATASVKPDGSAWFNRSDKPATITLSLTASAECGQGLLHLVSSVCATAFNGNNLEAVKIAIQELAYVMEASIYAGNPNGVYHVAIDRQPGRIQIRVSDAGNTIDTTRANQYFPNATRQMDEFDCRPHPAGAGNLIRMAKNG